MNIAIFPLLFVLSGAIEAGQSWEFVYVVRSTELISAHGQGELVHTASGLSGILTDSETVSYHIEVRRQGAKAFASFYPLESDVDVSDLQGTFHQAKVVGGCWQTIQLHDGLQSLMLARNAPRCEP